MKSPLDPSLPYRAPLGAQNMYQQVPNQVPQIPMNLPQQGFQPYMQQGTMQQMHPYQQGYMPNTYGPNYQQPYYQMPQQIAQQPRALSPNVAADQDYQRRVEERNRQLMAAHGIPQNAPYGAQQAYDPTRMQKVNSQQNVQPLKASREVQRPKSKNEPSKVVPPTQSVCINPQNQNEKKMTQEQIECLKMQKYQKQMIEYQKKEALKNQQQQQQFLKEQEEAMRVLQMRKQQENKQQPPKLTVPDTPPQNIKTTSPLPIPVPIAKEHAKLEHAKPVIPQNIQKKVQQAPQPIPQTSPVKHANQPQPQTPQGPQTPFLPQQVPQPQIAPNLKQTPQPVQAPVQQTQKPPIEQPPQLTPLPPPQITQKQHAQQPPQPLPKQAPQQLPTQTQTVNQTPPYPLPSPKMPILTNPPQLPSTKQVAQPQTAPQLKSPVATPNIAPTITAPLVPPQTTPKAINSTPAYEVVKSKLKVTRDKIDNLINREEQQLAAVEQLILKQKQRGLPNRNKALFLVKQRKNFNENIENLRTRHQVIIKTLSTLTQQNINKQMVDSLDQANKYMMEVQEELEKKDWRQVLMDVHLNSKDAQQLTQEMGVGLEQESEVDKLYKQLENKVKKEQEMKKQTVTPPVLTQPVKVKEVPKMIPQPVVEEFPALVIGPPQEPQKIMTPVEEPKQAMKSSRQQAALSHNTANSTSNIAQNKSNIVPNTSVVAPKLSNIALNNVQPNNIVQNPSQLISNPINLQVPHMGVPNFGSQAGNTSNLVPKTSTLLQNLSQGANGSGRSETSSQLQNKLKKEPSFLPINKLPLTNSTLIQAPPPPPEPLQSINLPSSEQLPEEIELPPSLVHPSVMKAPVFPNNKVSTLAPPSQMGASLNYSESQKASITVPKQTNLPMFPSVLQAPPTILDAPIHPSKTPVTTSFLAQPLPSASAFVFGSSMMRDPVPQSK